MKKILASLLIVAALAGAYSVRVVQAGITCTLPFQLQNNTTADATQVMANYNALVTCFTNAAAAGVNNDITALIGLTTPLAPASGGSASYIGTGGGIAASQSVASLSPTGFILATGRTVTFKPAATNTNTVTLDVNGSGAKPVWRNTQFGPGPAIGGELYQDNLVTVQYDGTNWVVLNRIDQVGAVVPFAGPGVPPGYVLAQGGNLNRITYAPLFLALGTTYGVGDGLTTFGMPDLRGRAVAGTDAASGRNTNCGGGTLAATCGVQLVAISKAMIDNFALDLSVLGVSISDPGHQHGIPQGTAAVGAPSNLFHGAVTQTTTQLTDVAATGIGASLIGSAFTGGGGAGLQPFSPTAIVQMLIKL